MHVATVSLEKDTQFGYNLGTTREGYLMTTAAAPKRAEIKTRTVDEVKKGATEVRPRRGASLDDAFSAIAYKAPINTDGVAVLPADWDDGDERLHGAAGPCCPATPVCR